LSIFPSIQIWNYRSLKSPVLLPFKKRMQILIGRNNTGKSNILRAIAFLFNKNGNKINTELGRSYEELLSFRFLLNTDYIYQKFKGKHILLGHIEKNSNQTLPVFGKLENQNIILKEPHNQEFFNLFPTHYFFKRNGFFQDFQQEFGEAANRQKFLDFLELEAFFKGTVNVPFVRFITQPGTEPQIYADEQMLGNNISFGGIVDDFANLDRPAFENERDMEKLAKICEFMKFVGEFESVNIRVPSNKETIIVEINGVSRPLNAVGTGVEQLLIIGLASIGFSDRLVLIDEPELHLHPRAQKRMMLYLNDNT
jgi:AAA15 family ATPase/GTPase